MDDALDRIVTTKEQAHAASLQAYALAQSIIANGHPARIVVDEYDDDRSLQQNRYYWGPCLREISEQAQIGGEKWSAEAWHELFKRMFLGYEIKRTKIAGRKRKVVTRRLRSTRDLKVKPFSKYLDQLQAYAAGDLGVHFSVRDWQEWRG